MTSNDDTVQDTSRYLMEALAHLEVAAEIIKAHASGKAHQHWLKLFAYLLDVADVEAIKPDLESPLLDTEVALQDQNAADRTRGQLCLDAAGSGFRLHAGLLHKR